MYPYSHLFTILCVLFVISSCKTQVQENPPKVKLNEAKEADKKPADIDYYFTGTTATTAAYGPQNITRNILQDRQGYIWLATWEGIIRHDPMIYAEGGDSFTNFTNKEGLRPYRCFTMLEDRTGKIWFGTQGAGIYRYDPKAVGNKFTNLTTKEGLVNDRIGCIYEDKAGNIWIGTLNGLSKYDGQTFQNFTTQAGGIHNDINAIIEGTNGKLWLATRGNTYSFDLADEASNDTPFTSIRNNKGLTFQNVRTLLKDKTGNIWLGGNDGLWRFDGQTWNNYTTNFVGYIYQDKAGNLWTSAAANSDGNNQNFVLSRYENSSIYNNTVAPSQIRAEANMFFGILEDKEGSIWLGSLRGVCRYDGKAFDYFREGD